MAKNEKVHSFFILTRDKYILIMLLLLLIFKNSWTQRTIQSYEIFRKTDQISKTRDSLYGENLSNFGAFNIYLITYLHNI